jgi:hypothetical protein
MFYCQITNKLSRPSTPLRKVIALTRPKKYMGWRKNEETLEWEEVVIGSGNEIVRELNVSEEGEALWNGWNADQRTSFLAHLDAR